MRKPSSRQQHTERLLFKSKTVSSSLLLLLWSLNGHVDAWAPITLPRGLQFTTTTIIRDSKSTIRRHSNDHVLFSSMPGADIEQPPVAPSSDNTNTESDDDDSGSDIPTPTASSRTTIRGKVNEIDFCIAPADVSLSRAYKITTGNDDNNKDNNRSNNGENANKDLVGLSLTRALNNASNRVVRRIILARSWPSAEALNESLRQVASMEAARQKELLQQQQQQQQKSGAKCPVPRPILNVLTRQSDSSSSSSTDTSSSSSSSTSGDGKAKTPKPRSRTDAEYVADQIKSFQNMYGTLPGYKYAEDYLECILALATTGIESDKVRNIYKDNVYDEAYNRILSVLKSVGVCFEKDNKTKRIKIASKMNDQDICLSMMDKIQMNKKQQQQKDNNDNVLNVNGSNEASSEYNDETNNTIDTELVEKMSISTGSNESEKEDEEIEKAKNKKQRFKFWNKKDSEGKKENENNNTAQLTNDDLGGVLLSAKEPTMTRQLNILSNIVQRALLFGGDQELLVLAETLNADRAAFIERWYPGTTTIVGSSLKETENEDRPGVRYLNCLILLLRKCYDDGVVTDLAPAVRLPASYANAYERMIASAIELGSGYVKPSMGTGIPTLDPSIPKPRTAQEELGRFAVWESAFRQSSSTASSSYSPYPQDLVGSWEVRDEIGGETIGISTVSFEENGDVVVDPPLEGLRWRLDPGPTHLDTCTFQVLSTLDGTILQYRGFIDRGARLEARFSKRSIKIRGSVMFKMRDGGAIDYYKDILPINYRTGTTKFVMTKILTQ